MGDFYIFIMNRFVVIRSVGYEVRYIWECEWKSEFREDVEIKAMYECYVSRDMRVFRDFMDFREVFFGGRVDCY